MTVAKLSHLGVVTFEVLVGRSYWDYQRN